MYVFINVLILCIPLQQHLLYVGDLSLKRVAEFMFKGTLQFYCLYVLV